MPVSHERMMRNKWESPDIFLIEIKNPPAVGLAGLYKSFGQGIGNQGFCRLFAGFDGTAQFRLFPRRHPASMINVKQFFSHFHRFSQEILRYCAVPRGCQRRAHRFARSFGRPLRGGRPGPWPGCRGSVPRFCFPYPQGKPGKTVFIYEKCAIFGTNEKITKIKKTSKNRLTLVQIPCKLYI